MLNQIPPSRRLAILLSGIWLFVSGLFSSVIGVEEFFPNFNAAVSFLVSWLFVGVMPLGLVWGAAWVVSGYHPGRRQVPTHEPESSESETDQSRAGEFRQHLRGINYRKGFRRLWIIGAAFWYFYALAVSGYQIGEWVGYHYALLEETKSFTRAAEKKREYGALVAACNKAKDSICWVPIDRPDPHSLSLFPDQEYLPNCEKTQAFRDVLSRELRASGVDLPPAGARGEACPDILAIGIPKADWVEFWFVVLAPFFLMAIYLIGRWIIKGFVR